MSLNENMNTKKMKDINEAAQQNEPNPDSKKSKNTLIIVTIAIMVVVGVSFLVSKVSKSDSNSTTSNSAKVNANVIPSAKVSITSSGFNPATLEVNAGTQVSWTNTTDSTQQVAADPHALHNSIPDFNSKIVLNPNESYSYTFKKAGTYHYHDEMHPLNWLGIVVVK
jgi:plastocyanin